MLLNTKKTRGDLSEDMVSALYKLEFCSFFVRCLVSCKRSSFHETLSLNFSSWRTAISFLRISHWQFLSINMTLTCFLADYQWSVDKLMSCSASCGHKGIQVPQLRCLLDGTEVNISNCKKKPKPTLQPIACNRRDCPSRFAFIILKCHRCF